MQLAHRRRKRCRTRGKTRAPHQCCEGRRAPARTTRRHRHRPRDRGGAGNAGTRVRPHPRSAKEVAARSMRRVGGGPHQHRRTERRPSSRQVVGEGARRRYDEVGPVRSRHSPKQIGKRKAARPAVMRSAARLWRPARQPARGIEHTRPGAPRPGPSPAWPPRRESTRRAAQPCSGSGSRGCR